MAAFRKQNILAVMNSFGNNVINLFFVGFI